MAEARGLIAKNWRFLNHIQPKQRPGQRDHNKENCGVIHRMDRGNGNLRTFRQTHFDRGHVVTAHLRIRLVLRQPAMDHPSEKRQQHDEETDGESPPIPALPLLSQGPLCATRYGRTVHLSVHFNTNAIQDHMTPFEFQQDRNVIPTRCALPESGKYATKQEIDRICIQT